jgi:hypothetical protein
MRDPVILARVTAARRHREFMFWLLRVGLVVGVIFYLSPVRHGGETVAVVDGLMAWIGVGSGSGETSPATTAGKGERLESLWQALPDAAKRAVVEEVVGKGAPGLTSPKAPVDTLHPGDRLPAWRGEPHKPHG